MDPCIKKQKIQAMENYKRAKIAYNLALYSLTSIITCFFFSSPFWFPSITNHFFPSLPRIVSFCFNAKCFFVVGNLIVLILVGETKLKQSSLSSDNIYDQYVARSRSNHLHHVEEKKKNSDVPHGEEKKGQMRSSKSEVWGEGGMVKTDKNGESIKRGMRSSKSAVWGEGGMLKTEKITKVKKEEKLGMRSSKSAVWGEGGMLKTEKITKVKKEEKLGMRSSKSAVWGESGVVKIVEGKKDDKFEKSKTGMRSSKSAVWGEGGMVKMEKITEGKKEEKFEIKMGITSNKSAVWSSEEEQLKKKKSMVNDEEKKMGMKSSRSAVWSEKERGKGKMNEEEEDKKMGMRSCKSEIWSESEIVRLGKNLGKGEDVQLNMLNKRVEDFIARVNKQRLLEDG